MSNENKQPDERAAFEGYSKSSIGKNLTRRDNWYSNEMPETREEVARDAFRAGFRATQQATKGDQTAIAERCAQFAELYRKEHATSRDAEEACTEIAEACRQYATTPFPVAGSAGQAPIAEIRNVDNPDFEGEQYVHIYPRVKLETGTKLYAAPTAPSLTPERKTSNPHKGGTEAYLATEHFNEGWNACLDACAPSLTPDAGAVLTQAQRTAIQNALRWIPRHLEPEMHDALGELLAAQPTEQRMSDAARDVLAERARQVSGEGWDAAHDDGYQPGTLAAAASAYALAVADDIYPYPQKSGRFHSTPPDMWPFSNKWWKPKDYRTALVKSGALILAEIERIDRAAARKAEIEQDGGNDA